MQNNKTLQFSVVVVHYIYNKNSHVLFFCVEEKYFHLLHCFLGLETRFVLDTKCVLEFKGGKSRLFSSKSTYKCCYRAEKVHTYESLKEIK